MEYYDYYLNKRIKSEKEVTENIKKLIEWQSNKKAKR
jgi:hypothetical protein